MLTNPNLIADAIKAKQWGDLAELADVIQAGIPKDMAQTDPSRFRAWMDGLTRCHLAGWGRLNPETLRKLAKKNRKP